MTAIYRNGFILYGTLKVISVFLHFLGPYPSGYSITLSVAFRLIPSSVLLELGICAGFTAFFQGAELALPALRKLWRVGYLVLMPAHYLLGQIDSEVFRWLSIHLSFSYLRTWFHSFLGNSTVSRILIGDLPMFIAAFLLFCAALAISLLLLRTKATLQRPKVFITAITLFAIAGMTSTQWFMKAKSRARRIRPPLYTLSLELFENFSPNYRMEDKEVAREEFEKLVLRSSDFLDSAYPLMRQSQGRWTSQELKHLPDSLKPHIFLITMESLRGWKTGLHPDSSIPPASPGLDRFAREYGVYFPWAHANGYQSPDGLMSLHTGLLPHYKKTFFSYFTTIHTKSITEIFREAGYKSLMLLSSNPTFGNLTPWMQKWYDEFQFDPDIINDGPVFEKLWGIIDAESGTRPLFYSVFTTTLHPSYFLPKTEKAEPAPTPELRYDQCLGYTDRELTKLLQRIRNSDKWERSIIIISGDHSQPNPYQSRNRGNYGGINPGYHWTNLIVAGGWQGLPKPGIRTKQVSFIDVPYTLLKLCKIKARHHFMGTDLFETQEHPILGFHSKSIFRIQNRTLDILNLETKVSSRIAVDPMIKESYGLLGISDNRFIPPTPVPEHEFSSLKNVSLYYSSLIENDRIFPRP